MSNKALTLSLNLNDPNFTGLGRRKYTEKYTVIPVSAYPEPVTQAMTALYKLLKLDLTDETACLSILASPEGYPQRLIGPKVFQVDGVLGLKVDKVFYPFEQQVTEDEVVYTLASKKVAIQADGKNPVFKLVLAAGVAIKFPVYCNYADELNEGQGGYYSFAELEEALAVTDNKEAIAKIVGSPSAGGKTMFTALRYLPAQKYKVISAKNGAGKYGPTLEIIISADTDLEISTQQKNPETEKWDQVLTQVPAETVLKIQGNTSLKNSLMGAELTEADTVYLEVVSQSKNKEGKIVVDAFFDYEQSPLKFTF
jgi:hypothetical protein